MCTIQEAYNLWADVNLDQIVDDSIKDNEAEIIDAQVDQMRSGMAADGQPIGTLRNPEYALAKKDMGGKAELGMVDLYNFGGFAKGIHLIYGNDYIMPESTDWKNDELLTHYGERIFGFTNANQTNINKGFILPSLQTKLREAVKLN
jgi:hypothetical protein